MRCLVFARAADSASRLLGVILLAVSSLWAGAPERVLYSFQNGSDGANPNAGLVADKSGNLYGTTVFGGGGAGCSGGYGCGTVFELWRGAAGGWQEKVLYAFTGETDGCQPEGNLIFDSAGNLYGTTSAGGITACDYYSGFGGVFKLSPNPDGSWTETSLYIFKGSTDGASPLGGLVFDSSGNLFGTTTSGGGRGSDCENYCGTVFELSPGSGGQWVEKVLYAFAGSSDGGHPESSLVLDPAGNLYGTTYLGGAAPGCCGTVFELSPAGTGWHEATIYSFQGGGNGFNSRTGLVLNGTGTLYGTASLGGNGGLFDGGIAFELKPTGSQWNETMVYSFCSHNRCKDGSDPSGLFSDNAGRFYGTTEQGGSGSCGTVFTVIPPWLGWRETVMYSFAKKGGSDGCNPAGGVILDANGNLYGTTSGGGTENAGTVFEITPAVLSPP